MIDFSLIAVLKAHGWKTHTKNTLLCWNKKRLIEEIQALENNYACALEMSDNQYNLLQKMNEEKEQLKQQIEKMKNCYNCSNFCDRNVDCSSICVRNNPTLKQLKDYWKMKDVY